MKIFQLKFSLLLLVVLLSGILLFSGTENNNSHDTLFAAGKDTKAEIIIDNSSEQGFISKGEWYSDNAEGGENYKDDSLWAYANDKKDDEACWTPKLKQDGYYKVYIWYCGDPNGDHAEKAPFWVHTGSKKKEFKVNLKENFGKWNLIGTFKMKKKEKNFVRATSCGDGNAIADAAKFVYIGKKKK